MRDWEQQARSDDKLITYQLHIQLDKAQELQIGRLGKFFFPAGHYIYTGSAKRNLVARIRRHLSSEKKFRWHIDYLLDGARVHIDDVVLSHEPECECNRHTVGKILAPGFGAIRTLLTDGRVDGAVGANGLAAVRARQIGDAAGVAVAGWLAWVLVHGSHITGFWCGSFPHARRGRLSRPRLFP